jgi:Na+-transporting NADH:ubiquinone oxidoreductase subunit NqrB
MINTLPQLALVMTVAAVNTVAVGATLTTWRWDIDWKTVRSVISGSLCVGLT